MSNSMRKSETKTSFSLVDRFESEIKNGILTVVFHVPINFNQPIDIVLKSDQGAVLATLQEGVCERGRQTRSCAVGDWSGRCVLALCSESQSLERYLFFD